jgi:TRAP-type C4-dicarboxylate transport system permease small subunit
MTFLKKLDSFLTKVEGGTLVFFLGVMVLLAFLQVVLRNGFNSTILWVDILLRHLVLWIGFLGAALATSTNRHINIDALRRFLPPRIQSSVAVITDIFALFICYLLFRASATFVANEVSERSLLYADIPAWYSEIIIPAGFGLLMVHFFVRMLVSAQSAFAQGASE